MADFEVHPVGTAERLKALDALAARPPSGPPRGAVFATFRPKSGDVALFVSDGQRGEAAAVLALAEARALHATLGCALRIADCLAEPVKAVESSMPAPAKLIAGPGGAE